MTDPMSPAPQPPAPASLPRVQIVNREHPHFEEYGRFTGKVITMRFGEGKQMAEVKLEHCRHGADGCFVSVGDVRQVAER
jgi:regulator of RNase E activity RraA